MRYAADQSCQGVKSVKDMEKRYKELESSIRAVSKHCSEFIAPALAMGQ